MDMQSLQDLYIDELKDVLNAEGQIIKALKTMSKKATNPQLKKAFETHRVESEEHVNRLKQIFEGLGKKASGKKCKGTEGIIEEGKDFMEEAESDELLDAGMIASAQRIEHYEMAAYGTLRTYARLLGDTKAEKLLQKTLDEEKLTDEKLSKLAESGINIEAAEADEEE